MSDYKDSSNELKQFFEGFVKFTELANSLSKDAIAEISHYDKTSILIFYRMQSERFK